MNSYTKFSRALLFILLSISLFSSAVNAQNSTTSSKVILIDEGHGQYINASLLTGAIAYLKSSGFHVIELTKPITQQLLNGVDLVIIPNPSSKTTFTDLEMYSLGQWMTTEAGHGLMLLSNPFNNENASLNGAGNALNTLLSNSYITATQKFDTSSANGADYKVMRYANSTVPTANLEIKVNSSLPLPEVNNGSIVAGNFSKTIELTSTTITAGENNTIVRSGYDAFSQASDLTYSSQDQNLKLFVGFNLKQGRVILGGSTIMFSDLPNPYNANTPWINSANNKDFLGSLVDWSLNIKNQENTVEVNFSFFLSLMLTIGGVGVLCVVVGSFLYATGKDMKIFEVDQDFIKSQSADANADDKSGLTRSQKRLQQRMKNK